MYAQVEKPKDNKRRAVSNSVSQKKDNVKQGFGFMDNRPEAVGQRKLQQNIKTSNQLKQYQRFDGNVKDDQLVAASKRRAGHVVPVMRTGTPMFHQSGEKSPSYEENKKHTMNNNTIQMKLDSTDTIEKSENLQHGSNIKTFTAEGKAKEIQVPDGPAWFTLNSDEELEDEGTPFNLHAALLEISGSGKIYVHKLQTATTLNIINFNNHEDAKNKLREDKKKSFEFYSSREHPIVKGHWEKHCAEVQEKKYPMANDKKMAGEILGQSEGSVHGYKYNADVLRGEPEVVIYETEGAVAPVEIDEYNVSEWEGDETDGYSRKVVSTDNGDNYKQVGESKGSSNCNIEKIL